MVFKLDLTSLEWQSFSLETAKFNLTSSDSLYYRRFGLKTVPLGLVEGNLYLHHTHRQSSFFDDDEKETEELSEKVYMTRLDAEGKAFSVHASKQPFESAQTVFKWP